MGDEPLKSEFNWPINQLMDGGFGDLATDGMISGIPSLYSSVLDLSTQAQRALHDSVGQAQRPGGFIDARVSQISALNQAQISALLLQMEEAQ